MKLFLELFGTCALLELSIWTSLGWSFRRFLAAPLLVLVAATGIALVVVHPRVWTALLLFLTLYRCFNLSRMLKGRMYEAYLRRATLRTSTLLISAQLVITLVMAAFSPSRWEMLAGVQLGLAVIIIASTLRHIRTTREPVLSKSYADRDLPALSVAIPARNESDALEACLHSLVANNYPKLEIMVLDDCSSNARTPEIIRTFAHDGVVFVAGSEAEPTWLAKNWAYEKLAEAANGELLLFCGVDTRFEPDGLRTLVASLLEKNKSMLSVLPQNENAGLKSQLVQPIRYGWELALPRRLFQRPPVLSTCWLIKKSLLTSSGGFKAVSRSIVPESYFARSAAVTDGYGFIRTRAMSCQKSFEEQQATAIRTRYPQLHRRPELVALLGASELIGIVLPLFLCIIAVTQQNWWAAFFTGLAYILFTISWMLVQAISYGRPPLMGLLTLPVAIVWDVLLMHYSMFKYEFSQVLWKGRNVCIPVMHVVSRLP